MTKEPIMIRLSSPFSNKQKLLYFMTTLSAVGYLIFNEMMIPAGVLVAVSLLGLFIPDEQACEKIFNDDLIR